MNFMYYPQETSAERGRKCNPTLTDGSAEVQIDSKASVQGFDQEITHVTTWTLAILTFLP